MLTSKVKGDTDLIAYSLFFFTPIGFGYAFTKA